MKRTKTKSAKHSYKRGGFEAGLIKGSPHLVNNIYLKMMASKIRYQEFDLTVDEAASIISVLGCAIMDYTHSKRDLLKP